MVIVMEQSKNIRKFADAPSTRDTFLRIAILKWRDFFSHFEILHNHSLLHVYFDLISSPEYLMSSLSYKIEKAKNHLTT